MYIIWKMEKLVWVYILLSCQDLVATTYRLKIANFPYPTSVPPKFENAPLH